MRFGKWRVTHQKKRSTKTTKLPGFAKKLLDHSLIPRTSLLEKIKAEVDTTLCRLLLLFSSFYT